MSATDPPPVLDYAAPEASWRTKFVRATWAVLAKVRRAMRPRNVVLAVFLAGLLIGSYAWYRWELERIKPFEIRSVPLDGQDVANALDLQIRKYELGLPPGDWSIQICSSLHRRDGRVTALTNQGLAILPGDRTIDLLLYINPGSPLRVKAIAGGFFGSGESNSTWPAEEYEHAPDRGSWSTGQRQTLRASVPYVIWTRHWNTVHRSAGESYPVIVPAGTWETWSDNILIVTLELQPYVPTKPLSPTTRAVVTFR
jgi:hypothetical protein